MQPAEGSIRLNDIIEEILQRHPAADVDPVYKAYVYSAKVHQGQIRKSGEPYLTHPLAVAYTIARMGMDIPSVCSGLLHDTVEDTWATLDDVQDNFGEDVARLVSGVTKLSQFEIHSKQKRQVESFRKLLLATIDDPRVIVVKLADRLHNMQTIESMRQDKQERIARETLEIYAPIAHRMGIQWLNNELEDLSFRVLEPDVAADLAAKRTKFLKEHTEEHERAIQGLSDALASNEIPCSVTGRIKHLYSIHRKMEKEKLSFDEVFDIAAFRVIVEDVSSCYLALGVAHSLWKPVQGRFKDYIASPKVNGYQSLHSTVIGDNGALLEIQMRTREMHVFAEEGIAAHWAYKDGVPEQGGDQRELYRLMRQTLEATESMNAPDTFFQTVREKLATGQVFTFTPKGDSVELPLDATVLDFAFKIHTDVGLHCSGAMVNGRWVPVRHKLHTGDVVSVQTTSLPGVTPEWLKIAASPSAKVKIRSFLKERMDEESMRQGQEILERVVKQVYGRKQKPTDEEITRLARSMGRDHAVRLLQDIGSGRIGTQDLREKLEQLSPGSSSMLSRMPETLTKLFGRDEEQTDLLVGHESSNLLRLAKCCRPLEGDEIAGYVTRGRGVTVHRKDCSVIQEADSTRLMTARWEKASSDTTPQHPVRIRVQMNHTPGSLAAVSQAIARSGANITQTNVSTGDGGAEGIFVVLVRNRAQLDKMLQQLHKLKHVQEAARVG